MLEQLLLPDYQLQVAEDGESAWAALQQSDAPKMAILDWVMPVMSGPQVCRKVRSNPGTASTYTSNRSGKLSELLSQRRKHLCGGTQLAFASKFFQLMGSL